MYRIYLEKEYFHFCIAHFVIFNSIEKEPIHGHNYYLSIVLEGRALENNKLIDIALVKKSLKTICDDLDHHFIYPEFNPYLKISEIAENIIIEFNHQHYSIPKNEVLILPIENTTMEDLAKYILQCMRDECQTLSSVEAIEIIVEETKGQKASFRIELS